MTNCAYLITDGTGHFDFLKWQNDVKLWFKNKEVPIMPDFSLVIFCPGSMILRSRE